MATIYDLGPLMLIPAGEGRTFAIGDELVAVFHTREGQIYATQASCPHRGGPLADGLLGGNTLICPLHGWKFDLRGGEPLLGSCAIRTYQVSLSPDQRIHLVVDALELERVEAA